MSSITDRQKKYLLLVAQDYISTGNPVGSSYLIKKFKLSTSSATVRNELLFLEKAGFLEKTHTSSGRVPSAKGFKFYANEMKEKNISKDIKLKLHSIFAKRTMNIDQVIEEAAEAISAISNLTLVTNSNTGNELLKSLQYVPLNETNATIVLVSSSGKVESKLITVNSKVELDDIRIAIRILKDRLINTPLKNLATKMESLAPIISDQVKNYEIVVQKMIIKVFDFHTKQTSRVYGRTNIMKQEKFADPIKFMKIMDRLEDTSIWESIEAQSEDEDDTLRIAITEDQALISKKIETDSFSKEISIVGSERMNYDQALPILKYIEELVKGKK
ncbi:MAG: heat-inducible transcriptional repressor HrcA [Mycoplasma sp.]|nr:heat-inducible transcriptional repressor HrcA [Mycoplasma sp.]